MPQNSQLSCARWAASSTTPWRLTKGPVAQTQAPGNVSRARSSAMGGERKLAAITSVSLDVIGHVALAEQSYRECPFITAYHRDTIVLEMANGRLRDDSHSI